MRVTSTDKVASRLVIYLNKKLMNNVTEADDDQNYIMRLTGELDATGNRITERLYGNVEIVNKDSMDDLLTF